MRSQSGQNRSTYITLVFTATVSSANIAYCFQSSVTFAASDFDFVRCIELASMQTVKLSAHITYIVCYSIVGLTLITGCAAAPALC